MATVLLQKQGVEEPEIVQAEPGPMPYHWSVNALYHALDAGVFEHPERLELIQGKIIENPPMNPPHASLADIVAQMLRDALQPALVVREEKCIHIASDGEPVPDVSVVRGRRSDYSKRHPTPEDVALLVEVADTTADYDLGDKALQYAKAGVFEYWVALVNASAVVRHRDPTAEGYGEVIRLSGQDPISPLAAPDAIWTVDALLGREEH